MVRSSKIKLFVLSLGLITGIKMQAGPALDQLGRIFFSSAIPVAAEWAASEAGVTGGAKFLAVTFTGLLAMGYRAINAVSSGVTHGGTRGMLFSHANEGLLSLLGGLVGIGARNYFAKRRQQATPAPRGANGARATSEVRTV